MTTYSNVFPNDIAQGDIIEFTGNNITYTGMLPQAKYKIISIGGTADATGLGARIIATHDIPGGNIKVRLGMYGGYDSGSVGPSVGNSGAGCYIMVGSELLQASGGAVGRAGTSPGKPAYLVEQGAGNPKLGEDAPPYTIYNVSHRGGGGYNNGTGLMNAGASQSNGNDTATGAGGGGYSGGQLGYPGSSYVRAAAVDVSKDNYNSGTPQASITIEVLDINVAPSAPAFLVYDSALAGHSVVISWQASTDPDGDTVTYILEQSTDGGTTWEQIATGSNETSYEATVPTGKPSICYRVKATDGTAQSNYCTGEIVGILQSYENLLVGGGI